MVRGDTRTDDTRGSTGKGHLVRGQEGEGSPGEVFRYVAHSIRLPGNWVGLWLSMASRRDSGSSLLVCASLSQDEFQRGFWWVGRACELASPLSFQLSPISSSWWSPVSSVFLTETSCC